MEAALDGKAEAGEAATGGGEARDGDIDEVVRRGPARDAVDGRLQGAPWEASGMAATELQILVRCSHGVVPSW